MKYQELNWKEYIKYSYMVRNRSECIEYVEQNKWKTKKSIIYWLDYKLQNEYIIIPKWFEFDFNSVPCFWMCVVWKDEFMIAIIHDYLYSIEWKINIVSENLISNSFNDIKTGYWFYGETGEYLYNRKMADKIWLNWAIEEKKEIERVDVSKRAYLGYLAIRLWGRKTFRHNL